MQCPNCEALVQTDDRFCEECGTPLVNSPVNSPVNVTEISTKLCKKCGAAPEAIDADGYCSVCGFKNERRQVRETDRLEVNLQPNFAGASDRGLRHELNEDYLACAVIESSNTYIAIACDGVSSSQFPELASKAAAEGARDGIVTALQQHLSPETALQHGIAAALNEVCVIPHRSLNQDAPSTTIVAAVVQNSIATIAWLGDSRAYWIDRANPQLLTRDDSWFNEIVTSGQMSAAEASKSDKSHAITRWLGVDAKNDASPSIVQFPIPGSGYLLLCTDGLWNYAPEAPQLADLVKGHASEDAIGLGRHLVEFARSCGGRDNITVILLVV
jgi:PPM family protein phosphatase